MRIIIIPVRMVTRGLRRLLGDREADSLGNDVATFVNEVYDDTVGDLLRSRAASQNPIPQNLIESERGSEKSQ